jgi:FlaA1/EpsC-like NDP-sugar epimerase
MKYSRQAYASRLALLLLDIFVSVISLFLAAWLRMNFEFKEAMELFNKAFPLVFTIRVLLFLVFRTYAMVVKYSGLSNLIQIFNTVSVGSIIILGIVLFLRTQNILISRSIILIDYFILIFLLSSLRVFISIVLNWREPRGKENIVIIGSGKVGLLTRQWISRDPNSKFRLLAFIDDNPDSVNKNLDGLPILPPQKIKGFKIEKAIYAIEDIEQEKKIKLVEELMDQGISILKLPVDNPLSGEDFKGKKVKYFQIEDLLGRPPILTLDLDKENLYEGRTVMITGAAGSIGSEIVRQLIPFKPGKLVLVDQAESPLVGIELEVKENYNFSLVKAYLANICEEAKMEAIFSKEKPDFVFHAAAYKHVPIIEEYPEEGIKTNILGTKILADLSHQFKVLKFIMISTDKAVNPTNVMGASKRIAEIYTQSLNKISSTAFITTRFGNVLGSNGSVVPRFREQIEKGGPITVTHPDITRYFMTIPEASLLVVEAGALGQGGEIFLFDMGKPIKIADLAKKMVQLSGREVQIVFTGLRPGEKLFEELLVTKENTIPTVHPRLTIARVMEMDFEEIRQKIEGLIRDLNCRNELSLVKWMKMIVVEYKSENSPFQKLDV